MKTYELDKAFFAAIGAVPAPVHRRIRRQNRWDKEHIKTASTRLTRDWDERFRCQCRRAKLTRYAVISYMVKTWTAAMEMDEERSDSR